MTSSIETPPTNPDASFGVWISARRSEMNLTQDQLAARINEFGGTVLNGSVISHWESGNRKPNGMNLLAVCLALDVGIAEAQKHLHASAPPKE